MSVTATYSRTAGGNINICSFISNQPGVELGALQCSAGGIPVGVCQEGPHYMPGSYTPNGVTPALAATAGQVIKVYKVSRAQVAHKAMQDPLVCLEPKVSV